MQEVAKLDRQIEANKRKRKQEKVQTARYVPTAPHTHEYPAGKAVFDESSRLWTEKCSVCGFENTYEEL